MTITQPVNSSKAKRDKPRTKKPPPHSRAQEVSTSQAPTSIVCPPSGVQHTSTATPFPGQQQLPSHQSSLPWWSLGPPPPPNPWNWNMWSLRTFHQLTVTHQPGQANAPHHHQQLFSSHHILPPSTTKSASTQPEQTTYTVHNSPYRSSTSSSNSTSPVPNRPDNAEEKLDLLVSALSFSTVLGKSSEPLLSMCMSSSIKKGIWAGQYIDSAYLLEIQLVPDDDKAYEFSCSHSNTNKLSLTTSKPKTKVNSYNSWNKAFRVLTERVALKWLDQCLPMVQYVAEISDNIGKFSFAATCNYDIKFWLKKQLKPALRWNEIDNSLLTKCFSGSGREGYHAGASTSVAHKRNDRAEHKCKK